MPSEPASGPLKSRYAELAHADLEENRRRQAELMSHVEALREEEALLVHICNLTGQSAVAPLGGPTPGQVQGGASADFSVGQYPTEPSPDLSESGRHRPEKETAPKAGSKQPLLRDLVLNLLRTHDEPRLAREVHEEFLRKHPDRQPSVQVVRNTIEGLVAKGHVRRHKQGRSVMYSVSEPVTANSV
ncbi:BlaI/MecI/CopY family transcriptional regulator [Streptomyces enissocaesilis]|uniref:Regulatory protein n=1 Tax=Streptomyces enissocaesilis TaxID=332589 RepID=A0ABP6K832_9ACTN